MNVRVKNILSELTLRAVDIISFTAIGCLAGHVITRLFAVPALHLSKSYLGAVQGMTGCFIFIVLDQTAQAIFNKISPKKAAEPHLILARIIICIPVAALLTHGLFFLAKAPPLKVVTNIVIISTTWLAYTLGMWQAKNFHHRFDLSNFKFKSSHPLQEGPFSFGNQHKPDWRSTYAFPDNSTESSDEEQPAF